MKITAFEGNKGDCLLLQSEGGKNVLIDGGHVDPNFERIFCYHHNVAPTLGSLREAGKKLDLVCVSHVDQDHIGGVLSMLNDEFDWRVFEHQRAQGLVNVASPRHPRPPEIKAIWHNAFHEQLNMNRGDIEDALAAAAPASLALGGGPQSHGEDLFSRLATSMAEAAQMSRRIGDRQLGIALNPEFDGKLVLRNGSAPQFTVGDLRVSVLGPTERRLEDLREKWNAWLRSTRGKGQIRKLRRQAAIDEDALIAGDLGGFLQSAELGPAVGDRNSVTEQNVASIILMIEEENKRILLTGDALDDDIVEDMIDTGFADANGHAHLNVLKLQHHASENNFSVGFAKRVTADHYVFCGNGKHENPDIQVVRRLLDSRLGSANRRSPNPQVDEHFNLWFTSDGSTFKANSAHMKKLIKLVKSAHDAHPGRFSFHFSDKRFLSFSI